MGDLLVGLLYLEADGFFLRFCFIQRGQEGRTIAPVSNGFDVIGDPHFQGLFLLAELAAQGFLRFVGTSPPAGLADQLPHDGPMRGSMAHVFQHCQMKPVGIHPADGALFVPVCFLADIVVNFVDPPMEAGLSTRAAAVRTHNTSAQVVHIRVNDIGAPGTPPWSTQRVLHGLPGLRIDDGYPGIFLAPIAKLKHPLVSFIGQQPFDRRGGPLPGRNGIEVLAHGGLGVSFQEQVIGPPQDGCLLRVCDKAFGRLVIRLVKVNGFSCDDFLHSERRIAAGEEAGVDHCFHFGAGPAPNLLDIHAVHELGHFLVDVAGHVIGKKLLDHFHPDAGLLQQILGDGEHIASAKAAHISDDHGIEIVGLSIGEKLLEALALQGCATDGFICIVTGDSPALRLYILSVERVLHIGRGEVLVLLVIGAAPRIDGVSCYCPNLLCHAHLVHLKSLS